MTYEQRQLLIHTYSFNYMGTKTNGLNRLNKLSKKAYGFSASEDKQRFLQRFKQDFTLEFDTEEINEALWEKIRTLCRIELCELNVRLNRHEYLEINKKMQAKPSFMLTLAGRSEPYQPEDIIRNKYNYEFEQAALKLGVERFQLDYTFNSKHKDQQMGNFYNAGND